MKVFISLFIILGLQSGLYAQKVYLEDSKKSNNYKYKRKEAFDGFGMRAKRRVGIGSSLAGSFGFMGMSLEMNIKPEWGVAIGYGGGPGYSAFNFEYKKYISGQAFMPFLAAGFSRWYGPAGGVNPTDTNPSFLGEKFLKGSDKENGQVDEFLFYPKLGIQYMNLAGEWAGFALHADVLLLIDPLDMVMAPTASFGATYYF